MSVLGPEHLPARLLFALLSIAVYTLGFPHSYSGSFDAETERLY